MRRLPLFEGPRAYRVLYLDVVVVVVDSSRRSGGSRGYARQSDPITTARESPQLSGHVAQQREHMTVAGVRISAGSRGCRWSDNEETWL